MRSGAGAETELAETEHANIMITLDRGRSTARGRRCRWQQRPTRVPIYKKTISAAHGRRRPTSEGVLRFWPEEKRREEKGKEGREGKGREEKILF